MHHLKKQILGIQIVALAFMPACHSGGGNGSTQAADSLKVVTITTIVAQGREYTPTLELSGTAEAIRRANLGTTIPGRVERMHCRRGQKVSKGELLVEMSDEMLLQAQVERDALKQDVGRLRRLKEKGTVASMELEHLEARYEAAEAKVAMLKSNTSITAPFNGTVTKVFVQEGENYSYLPSLAEGFKLEAGIVQLQQLDPLKVVTAVNERQLATTVIGAQARVVFDAYPNDTVYGSVSYIAPELSRATRACEVEIEIANCEEIFKPGMYCKVLLSLKPSRGVFVPLRALVKAPGTGDEFVFTIDGTNTAHRKPITRGELVGAWIKVKGVQAGERVALEGKSKLQEGSQVVVTRGGGSSVPVVTQGGER